MKNNTFTCEKCHKSCKDNCTDFGTKGKVLHIYISIYIHNNISNIYIYIVLILFI